VSLAIWDHMCFCVDLASINAIIKNLVCVLPDTSEHTPALTSASVYSIYLPRTDGRLRDRLKVETTKTNKLVFATACFLVVMK